MQGNDDGQLVLTINNDWYSKYALRLRSLCDYFNRLLWKEATIKQIIAISYFESIPAP